MLEELSIVKGCTVLDTKKLDKRTPVPLYYQLKQLILQDIENGSYPVGSMIPTESELAAMFDISRTTVRQAMTELVHEGKLYRVKSRGTFVSEPKIGQEFMQKLRSYNDEMRSQGHVPSTNVLSLEIVAMPSEMDRIRNSSGAEKAILLNRVRFADGCPIVYVKTYMPYELCRFVMEHDFSQESLYKVLSAKDETRIYKVTRICSAVAAGKNDAEILDIKRGAPIHHFISMGYNQSGELIEYSLARYRGDKNQFQVDVYPL